MAIKFVGLNELSDTENSILNRICKSSMPKIERTSKKANLTLIIKKHEKEGAKAKFSLAANMNAPPLILKAKSDDWDFATALHKVFDKLEIEISKKEKKRRQKTVTV